MINRKYLYAVVGASKNEEKYGFQVLRDLNNANYNVVPINLREKEMLGLKVYHRLQEVESKIDVVIFVVPPQITLKILEDVFRLGVKKVWMQPGSESREAIKYCENHQIECITNACIMIKKNN